MTSVFKAAAAGTMLVGLSGFALADDGRAPTDAERASIQSALKTQGFSSWGEVEFDDGKWEVDNAVHSDGKVYDVDLSAGEFGVLKKDIDD